ncbi:MAG: hypothetical protein ACRC7N_20650, partial [Clostridium sp.]
MKDFILLYMNLLKNGLIKIPFALIFFTIIFSFSPITGCIFGFISCYFVLDSSYRDVYNLLTIMPIRTVKLIGVLYCPVIYVVAFGYLVGGIFGVTFTPVMPIKLFLTATLVMFLQNLLIPMNFKHGFSSSASITFAGALVGVGLLSAFLNFIIHSGAFDDFLIGNWLLIVVVSTVLVILSGVYSYRK